MCKTEATHDEKQAPDHTNQNEPDRRYRPRHERRPLDERHAMVLGDEQYQNDD